MQRSSVVLPAPFGPRRAKALAGLDREREVAQHLAGEATREPSIRITCAVLRTGEAESR
jgi:hypothetical protein